jgi:hypothetical protein
LRSEEEAAAAKSIEPGHLLLGLLKNATDHQMFQVLKQRGITYETARATLFEETTGGTGT